MYSPYITISVQIPLVGEVELFAHNYDFSLQNDGIGAYECHGFRGYDKGEDYIWLEDIHWNRDQYSEQQNVLIWDWVNEQSGGDNCPYQGLCDLAGHLFVREY
jgi:hypothetical protein